MMCDSNEGGGMTTISPSSRIAPETEIPVVSRSAIDGRGDCGSLHPINPQRTTTCTGKAWLAMFTMFLSVVMGMPTNESVKIQRFSYGMDQVFNNVNNIDSEKMLQRVERFISSL
jgi:hypothetical protein